MLEGFELSLRRMARQTPISDCKQAFAKRYQSLRKRLDSVGVCHAQGVKDIRNITPIFEVANRKCLILSDNDAPALERKKRHQENCGYGKWLTYSDLLPNSQIITGEDFIKPEPFIEAANGIRTRYPGLAEISETDLNGVDGKISNLRRWAGKENADSIVKQIKQEVFSNLLPQHIEPSYFEYLETLSKLLN